MIETMFETGAHYAGTVAMRHPSAKPYIFGRKNSVELFDLEKTKESLVVAKEYVRTLASQGKMILFVGSKAEAKDIVKNTAVSLGMPYVTNRFKGGSLTNFPEIRKRVKMLEDLKTRRDSGDLAKFTKREQGQMDKEIAELEDDFGGLALMTRLPDAVFIVDVKREHIAHREAVIVGAPVISLSSSDADFDEIDYPLPANDATRGSISFFMGHIAEGYKAGKVAPVAAPTA